MKFKNVLIFGLGTVVGSAITYKIVSDKYEALIQEEIDSVKEALGYTKSDIDEEDTKDEADAKEVDNKKVYEPLKTDKKDYEHMVAYYGYYNNEERENNKEDEEEQDEVEPEQEEDRGIEFHKTESMATGHSFKDNIYVIAPEEYGALVDYDLIDLTYYNDNVLCDDMDEIVENIDDTVGRDYANHFGEFDEQDVIHVRNDILKCDYEITRDTRDYSDVIWGRPPHYDV